MDLFLLQQNMKIGGQNKNITPVFWRWGSWSGAVGELQKLPNRKISFSFSLAPLSRTTTMAAVWARISRSLRWGGGSKRGLDYLTVASRAEAAAAELFLESYSSGRSLTFFALVHAFPSSALPCLRGKRETSLAHIGRQL